MAEAERYLGLMSGTSLDGVDATLIQFEGDRFVTLSSFYTPFEAGLRKQLAELALSSRWTVSTFAAAETGLTRAYAAAAHRCIDASGFPPPEINAVGAHGQTIRHWPKDAYTCQLINPSLLAELTGIGVASFFRQRDLAAGGQGAPLVTGFQAGLCDPAVHNTVFLNIGGVANISLFEGSAPRLAYDTGPGNSIMDKLAEHYTGQPCDTDGRLADAGCAHEGVIEAGLSDAYFSTRAPKSTGPEHFNLLWWQALPGARSLSPEDSLATARNLTATSISRAILSHRKEGRLYVFGGGTRNPGLLKLIRDELPGYQVDTTATLGINEDFFEASAFAWLARQLVHRQPGNEASTTGAKGPRILGGWFPA